jgi:hypothetical protein
MLSRIKSKEDFQIHSQDDLYFSISLGHYLSARTVGAHLKLKGDLRLLELCSVCNLTELAVVVPTSAVCIVKDLGTPKATLTGSLFGKKKEKSSASSSSKKKSTNAVYRFITCSEIVYDVNAKKIKVTGKGVSIVENAIIELELDWIKDPDRFVLNFAVAYFLQHSGTPPAVSSTDHEVVGCGRPLWKCDDMRDNNDSRKQKSSSSSNQ